MFKQAALFVLSVSISFASFSQFGPSKEVVPAAKDKTASYPGGLEAFYEFVQRELRYPSEARVKNIEGQIFIEFIVTASGYIDPNSVKTIKGIDPSCDREGERVIKLITIKWTPGLDTHGNPVDQRLILPLSFKLADLRMPGAPPSHTTKRDINPVKTVIIEKPVKTDKPSWIVFTTSALTHETGRLMPGDSVDVSGWGPWCYQVKNNTVSGYVSWKAVKVIPALDSLARVVAVQSAVEDKKDSIAREYTYQQMKAEAHLRITTSKKEVYVGECFNVDVAFNVAKKNAVRLQFVELSDQINYNILPVFLADSLSYRITSTSIEEVEGVVTQINGEVFTRYSFYNIDVCPLKAGHVMLKKLSLNIARIKQDNNEVSWLETFESQPVSIKVKPLPSGLNATQLTEGSMVGRFTMKESLSSTAVKTGTPVEYQIMIEGPVTTDLIEPPKIKLENCIAHVKDIIRTDTLVLGENRIQKTFVYSLTFIKEGTFDLSDKIAFRFFNTKTASMSTLRSTSKGVVAKGERVQTSKTPDLFQNRQNLILVDGSQSMMIEDYEPNRFTMVKTGIADFLTDGYAHCNTSLITFAATAKYVNVSTADSCYSGSRIRAIDFNRDKNGTAIGDAIWFALNTINEETGLQKLIVIGDGDNTAGWLSPYKAALYAKKKNIKVYTIGVGHTGHVKFGVDAAGKPQMIDNTFSTIDLKKIASLTGGTYYWAEDAKTLTRILADILSKP